MPKIVTFSQSLPNKLKFNTNLDLIELWVLLNENGTQYVVE